MKKVFHKNLHDWAVPENQTDPFYVIQYSISISEIKQMLVVLAKNLAKFAGRYQLVLEFTEPNTDPRFVVGHVGAVIGIYAETQQEAELIRNSIA